MKGRAWPCTWLNAGSARRTCVSFPSCAKSLKSLPPAAVPERLRTQLQVLASRERARWNATKTVSLALHNWARQHQAGDR